MQCLSWNIVQYYQILGYEIGCDPICFFISGQDYLGNMCCGLDVLGALVQVQASWPTPAIFNRILRAFWLINCQHVLQSLFNMLVFIMFFTSSNSYYSKSTIIFNDCSNFSEQSWWLYGCLCWTQICCQITARFRSRQYSHHYKLHSGKFWVVS